MAEDRPNLTEPRYRASAKNLLIFAVMWLGEGFLVLMFGKWVTHETRAVYLLMVPWTLFGLIVVIRLNWILRLTRAFDKALEDAGAVFENGRRRVLGSREPRAIAVVR